MDFFCKFIFLNLTWCMTPNSGFWCCVFLTLRIPVSCHTIFQFLFLFTKRLSTPLGEGYWALGVEYWADIASKFCNTISWPILRIMRTFELGKKEQYLGTRVLYLEWDVMWWVIALQMLVSEDSQSLTHSVTTPLKKQSIWFVLTLLKNKNPTSKIYSKILQPSQFSRK